MTRARHIPPPPRPRTGACVIGVDADARNGISFAEARDGVLVSASTIQRADYKGRVYPGYERALLNVVKEWRDAEAVVYVEGIYAGRNLATYRALAEVQGELAFLLRWARVSFSIVPAPTWQCQILPATKGRDALKARARVVAARHLPDLNLSDHEADASCICLYGIRQQRKESDHEVTPQAM